MAAGVSGQFTFLFGDWGAAAGSLTASGQMDAFAAQVDNSLAGLAATGAQLAERGAQSFAAIWQLGASGEDEPGLAEHATQAANFAMLMRDSLASFGAEGYNPLRLALATGTARVDGGESSGPLASNGADFGRRMLAVIPDGGVAVDQATFALVHGGLNFRPLAQLPLRGLPEPVDVYRLVGPKSIHYRIQQPGLEGVTTRLVGRELEWKRLREAYEATTDDRENHLVTIAGEAGLGKTRLLVEAERWRDLIPDATRLFRAHAAPETYQQPYGLLRRVLMNRFGIQESDSEDEAMQKLQAGLERFMGPGRLEDAQRIAMLIGLPCSGCPKPDDGAAAGLLEQQALNSLAEFFRDVDAQTPRGVIALHLEDVQWADDKSLDAVLWLLQKRERGRIIVVCLASPELLERRPRWGLEVKNSIRIDLYPLAVRDARRLVREALQKASNLPDALVDWVVERSGGNPLYIEELVRVLTSSGVVVRGEESQPWTVDLSRLAQVRVPDTLTGLLQTQLAGLPLAQRTVLQRGAVFGRFFWDHALTALEAGDGLSVQMAPTMNALVRRNLVYRQERSAYAGMQEYTFLSSLVQDAAILSIPPETLRRYHALAGEWLEGLGGELQGPAARIAGHFQRAGQDGRAVKYLALAADEARRHNAYEQARQFLLQAVEAAPETPESPDQPGKAALSARLGETLIWQGEGAQALPYLEAGLELARRAGDVYEMAELLGRLGWAAYYTGDLTRATTWLDEAVGCARQSGNLPALALALRQLGNVTSERGDYSAAKAHYRESLAICREIGDLPGVSLALNNLGLAAIETGDFTQARLDLQQSIASAEGRGDQMGIALGLGNLGIAEYLSGEPQMARGHLQQSIDVSRTAGSQLLAAESLIWRALAEADIAAQQAFFGMETDAFPELAKRAGLAAGSAAGSLREGLAVAEATNQTPLVLGALAGFAWLHARGGEAERAVELLALVSENPALDHLLRVRVARPLLERLVRELPPQTFGQAWARGQGLALEAALARYREPGR